VKIFQELIISGDIWFKSKEYNKLLISSKLIKAISILLLIIKKNSKFEEKVHGVF
jgi:hypothetical protein